MSIGETIAKLRREKGITQETLARAVGVSPPAVSKWERGGSPDIDLLPSIADVFEISIDELFGREIPDRTDAKAEIFKRIASVDTQEERLRIIFDFCWFMPLAMFGIDGSLGENAIEAVTMRAGETPAHSAINDNCGFARVRLNEKRRYFLFAPEPQDGWRFENVAEYTQLFAALADEHFLKALLLLHKNQNTAFTSRLLVNELGCDERAAANVIARFKTYDLIDEQDITLDNEPIHFFLFKENPAIVPFLIFAEEMIQKTKYYSSASLNRDKCWLS